MNEQTNKYGVNKYNYLISIYSNKCINTFVLLIAIKIIINIIGDYKALNNIYLFVIIIIIENCYGCCCPSSKCKL